MKIIVIPDYPALESRRYRIADSLAENGNEVHYLMWDFPFRMHGRALVRHFLTSLFTKEYQYERITVHKISRLPYYWPYINGILFRLQLKRLFKRLQADIIFTQTYTNETEVPKSLPFVYDLADDYAAPGDLYGSAFYKLAFRLLDVRGTMRRQCKNARAVTVLSEILYKFAKQYNHAVYKLPDGVEQGPIKEVLADSSTYPSNEHDIVYVTGFGPWSRPIETMQVVKELRDEFPDIDLTMIGDGVQRDNIKRFIAENDAADYIHFLGYVRDRKELFTRINRATIGLNISEKNKWRDAAHPIKVLEYSAIGKKVVSTNLAEVEALGFPNIFIFSDAPEGPHFKDVLRNALQHRTKEHEYADISRQVLKEYNWDTLTSDLVELIERSLKQ